MCFFFFLWGREFPQRRALRFGDVWIWGSGCSGSAHVWRRGFGYLVAQVLAEEDFG